MVGEEGSIETPGTRYLCMVGVRGALRHLEHAPSIYTLSMYLYILYLCSTFPPLFIKVISFTVVAVVIGVIIIFTKNYIDLNVVRKAFGK